MGHIPGKKTQDGSWKGFGAENPCYSSGSSPRARLTLGAGQDACSRRRAAGGRRGPTPRRSVRAPHPQAPLQLHRNPESSRFKVLGFEVKLKKSHTSWGNSSNQIASITALSPFSPQKQNVFSRSQISDGLRKLKALGGGRGGGGGL